MVLGQREQLSVFGDDYDTPDGTCVRDYMCASTAGCAARLPLPLPSNCSEALDVIKTRECAAQASQTVDSRLLQAGSPTLGGSHRTSRREALLHCRTFLSVPHAKLKHTAGCDDCMWFSPRAAMWWTWQTATWRH